MYHVEEAGDQRTDETLKSLVEVGVGVTKGIRMDPSQERKNIWRKMVVITEKGSKLSTVYEPLGAVVYTDLPSAKFIDSRYLKNQAEVSGRPAFG